MPFAPPRPCTFPGCRALVPAGKGPRCDLHRKQDERERSRRRRADPEDQIHFHNSHEWRSIRESWLRVHPLCGDRLNGPSAEHSKCLQEGRATSADVVDHVVAIEDGGDRRDPTNFQSLCKPCHESKTWTRYNERRREGK